ncbi:unnamed protein product, partial [Effrenium voratum]
ENVDRLRLIQLGAAVADADGTVRGAWSFNLAFDIEVDLHTEKSMAFLRAAGLDFTRHKKEGIDPVILGRKFASSLLVGQRAPCWVTFAGSYDLAYLLKLLTSGQPLPRDSHSFDVQLGMYCRRNYELRDYLPHGSLDAWARRLGVQRFGRSHTAGSDALLTLNLFLVIFGPNSAPDERKWGAWQTWQEQWDQQCVSAGMSSWELMQQQARWQAAWQYHANLPFAYANAAANAAVNAANALSTQPGHSQWSAIPPPVPSLQGGMPACCKSQRPWWNRRSMDALMPAATFWNTASPFSMQQDIRAKFQI